jgi:hypothetical protein
MDIKPIETFYNGYRFRSRLEARWAVFFDAMGIKYLYEPEGYRLSDGTCYLPDFYLPEMQEFFEVKGVLKLTDKKKICKFIQEYNRPVVIGYDNLEFVACYNCGKNDFRIEDPWENKESSVLMKCNRCNNYYFTGINGTWECLCCSHYDGDNTSLWVSFGNLDFKYLIHNKEQDVFKNAVKKAKQARFEHGESGK